MVHGHRGVKYPYPLWLLWLIQFALMTGRWSNSAVLGRRYDLPLSVMRKLIWTKVHHVVWRLSRYELFSQFPRGLVLTDADFYTLNYLTNESTSAIS